MSWQWYVVVAVAIGALGYMSYSAARLFSRKAGLKATVRPGTAVESALVGGVVPEGARVFDGWSYRVGARFAGRVRIAVYEHAVAVAGPRVPAGLYGVWIWAQSLLLASTLPALVAALVLLDWRWLVAAAGLLVASFAVSIVGAGLWPGFGELAAAEPDGGLRALEFPRDSVREVDVGKGWQKGGLEVVLFPYAAGIDKMAAGRAVSFFAPDETGHEVRFAIDMYTEPAARDLARLLDSGAP